MVTLLYALDALWVLSVVSLLYSGFSRRRAERKLGSSFEAALRERD